MSDSELDSMVQSKGGNIISADDFHICKFIDG